MKTTAPSVEFNFSTLGLLRLGPFRLFFPLGVLAGLLGVGHWTLWSVGWISSSNSVLHASLMAKGFLALVVTGFLMTALPRFLGTQEASLWEVGWAGSAGVGFIGCELFGAWRAAEWLFLALILSLITFAGRRLPHRTQNPPDPFLLLGFGLFHALAGSTFMLAASRDLTARLHLFEVGRQMGQTGFLLCMVLGVTGFLAPFLMGYGGEELGVKTPSRPWRKDKLLVRTLHGLTGLALLSSFLMEPFAVRTALVLRASVVSLHLALFARIARLFRKKHAYVVFFYLACWMVPIGLWFGALWPAYRIAGLHILFIGGFSLMIFSFGTLVVLSHSAQAPLLTEPLCPLKVIGGLVLLAMILRVTADLEGWHYQRWIHVASTAWLLAALTWLFYILPKLWLNPLDVLKAARHHPPPRQKP